MKSTHGSRKAVLLSGREGTLLALQAKMWSRIRLIRRRHCPYRTRRWHCDRAAKRIGPTRRKTLRSLTLNFRQLRSKRSSLFLSLA
jgi:hypothetical protein